MAFGAKQAMKSFVCSLPAGKRLISLVSGDQAPAAVTLSPRPFADENRAELGRLGPDDAVYFTYSAGGLLVGAKYEAVTGELGEHVRGEITLVREGNGVVFRASGVPPTDQDEVRKAIAGVSGTRVRFDYLAEEDLAAEPLTDNGEPPSFLADLWAAHDPDSATTAWRSDFREFAGDVPLISFLDAVERYRAWPSLASRNSINRTYLNRVSSQHVKVEPQALAMFSALPESADAQDLDAVASGACSQYSRYDEFTSTIAAQRKPATAGEGSGGDFDSDTDGYDADDEWNIENMKPIVVDLDGEMDEVEDGRRAPLTQEQRRNLAAARRQYGS